MSLRVMVLSFYFYKVTCYCPVVVHCTYVLDTVAKYSALLSYGILLYLAKTRLTHRVQNSIGVST
jgi:hypothetical protein